MPIQYDRVVTPVYIVRSADKLEHLGTAVLVQSGEGRWLLTAAHVLANRVNGAILLPSSQGFIQLTGNAVASCMLNPEAANRDSIDLCYTRLNEDQASRVLSSGAEFLPFNETNFDPHGRTPCPGIGTVTGFPAKSVQIENRHSRVKTVFLRELDFVSDERLVKAGFNPEFSMGLSTPRKFFSDGIPIHDLQLNGLSGGAIWRHDRDGPCLVGIATEFHSHRSLLIGTRLTPLVMDLASRLRAAVRRI